MQNQFYTPHSRTSSNSTPIRASGHVVGKVKGDTFYKTIDGSRHFLRVPPAICFDEKSLKEAEQAGAVHVAVTDRETGKAYHASIRFVWENGFKVNRGFGNQIALPFDKWQITGEPSQLALL
jgi:hypothetical protein